MLPGRHATVASGEANGQLKLGPHDMGTSCFGRAFHCLQLKDRRGVTPCGDGVMLWGFGPLPTNGKREP